MKMYIIIKSSLYHIFLCLILLLLVGCSIIDFMAPPTPTDAFLSEQEAIEMAIGDCATARLQAEDEPHNIRSALMTLGEVQNAQSSGSFWPYSQPPHHMVWIVTMDGKWRFVGGPSPEDGAEQPETPQLVNHCTVILDAETGSSIHITFNRRDDF